MQDGRINPVTPSSVNHKYKQVIKKPSNKKKNNKTKEKTKDNNFKIDDFA